jgi:ABC-type branched-subunit amino acid transport system ATPase component
VVYPAAVQCQKIVSIKREHCPTISGCRSQDLIIGNALMALPDLWLKLY